MRKELDTRPKPSDLHSSDKFPRTVSRTKSFQRLRVLNSPGKTGTGTAPFSRVVDLAGYLGPCLSDAERGRGASQVVASARALAAALVRDFDVARDDNDALAADLPVLLTQLRLCGSEFVLTPQLAQRSQAHRRGRGGPLSRAGDE